MALICPVCNGLQELKASCRHCYTLMSDRGLVENYYGPYAPYEELELINLADATDQDCIHIVTCSQCGYDTKVVIKMINL